MNHHLMSLELKNDAAEITRLTAALAEMGQRLHLPTACISRMRLALEEIVSNIVNHGFDDDGEHVIRVDLTLEDNVLTARVEDDGQAFDPLERAAPDTSAPLEERAVGGLGIHIVRRLMDHVHYERVGDRNVLTIKKATGQSGD